MKTFGGVFSKICDFENLVLAYQSARRGKKESPEAMRFHERAESNLLKIQEDLLAGRWEPDPYRQFVQIGPVKRRVIQVPSYRDRITHHAIAQIILPLLERRWIYDSYACRKGKGSHAAVARLQAFLYRCPRHSYVLQLDVSRYYPSIDHQVLLELLGQTLRDNKAIALMERLLFGFAPEGKGIPIGAYTSQIFANVYLDEMDHFVKECLGMKQYLRYMDDAILVDGKKELRAAWMEIKWLLEVRLKLKLNPKSKLFPAASGVDFCGYRTWHSHIRPRKRTIRAAKIRFRRLSEKYSKGIISLADVQPRVASFLGYMKKCNGRHTTNSTLRNLVLKRER